MKEFGHKEAIYGIVLCEVSDCEANCHASEYPSGMARTMATGHELTKNHPTVVVYKDEVHKIPAIDAAEVLRLTGVHLSEDLLADS